MFGSGMVKASLATMLDLYVYRQATALHYVYLAPDFGAR
jgi:hypothetical protein